MHWNSTVKRIYNTIKRNINNRLVQLLVEKKAAKNVVVTQEKLFKIVNNCMLQPSFGTVIVNDKRFFLDHILPANYKSRYAHLNSFEILKLRLGMAKKPIQKKDKVFVWGNKWSLGYYHFLSEDLPKLIYAKQAGLPLFTWRLYSPKWQQELCNLFNIGHQYIDESLQVDQMYYIADNRIFDGTHPFSIPHPELLQGLRQQLQKNEILSLANAEQKDILWISRKYTYNRHVVNEMDCITVLKSAGWNIDIIYPEKMSVADQIKKVYNSNWIIGPHGAGLTNIIFSQTGRLVEIGPPVKINNSYISLATALSGSYHYYQARPVNKYLKSRSNLYVDAQQLLELMRSLLNEKV